MYTDFVIGIAHYCRWGHYESVDPESFQSSAMDIGKAEFLYTVVKELEGSDSTPSWTDGKGSRQFRERIVRACEPKR